MLMLSIILACVNEAEKTNIQNLKLKTHLPTPPTPEPQRRWSCTQESEAFNFIVTVEGYNAPFPDFTLQTTTGPWQLSSEWTGCDVYVFSITTQITTTPYKSGNRALTSCWLPPPATPITSLDRTIKAQKCRS